MSLAELEPPTRLKTLGKVLVIDIERLPGTAYVWEPKTRYIAPRNFVEWPRMLSFAARWYGQKTPIFEAEWIDRDKMIRRAWELYDQADAVYTYNGIRFDDKHLRSEWLLAGLTPPRPWKAVDLYKQVQQFGFESKSLDSVSRRLGRPGKELHYSMDLAWAAARGDKAAQRELRTYNIGDVELTEWLADRLRPWLQHPHTQTLGDDLCCPNCGSTNLTRRKSTYKAVLIDYTLYTCECGKHLKGAWHARTASVIGVK